MGVTYNFSRNKWRKIVNQAKRLAICMILKINFKWGHKCIRVDQREKKGIHI